MKEWNIEAKKMLEKFNENYIEHWDEAMEFLLDYQAEKEDLGIVDEDMINEIVKMEAEKWGYQRVACFLSEIIHNLNQDYYRLDGYGNLDVIDQSWIEIQLEDIAGAENE